MIATTAKKILSSLIVTLNLSTPISAEIVDGESVTFNCSTGIGCIINAEMYFGSQTSNEIFVEIYSITNDAFNPDEDDPGDGTLEENKPKKPKDDTDKDKSNHDVSEEDNPKESKSEEL